MQKPRKETPDERTADTHEALSSGRVSLAGLAVEFPKYRIFV